MIPILATAVRALSSKLGRDFMSPAGKKAAESAGLGAEYKTVRASLQRTVRDQASNLRTGRRFDGVKLELDESARRSFDYSELVDRVAAGERPNVAARKMLAEAATLKLKGQEVRGAQALEAAEKVTKWNRQYDRLKKNPRGFVTPEGVRFSKSDVESLLDDGVYKVTAKAARDLQSLTNVLNNSPGELMVRKDGLARGGFMKSLRNAQVPTMVRNHLARRMSEMGPTELVDTLKKSPQVTMAAYSSDGAVYAANIHRILYAWGLDKKKVEQYAREGARAAGIADPAEVREYVRLDLQYWDRAVQGAEHA